MTPVYVESDHRMSYKEQNLRQKRMFDGGMPWDELMAAASQQPTPTWPEDDMRDLVREIGLQPTNVVLDVGSYGGRHAIPLAAEFGCHSIALDLVWGGLSQAPDAIQAAGVQGSVSLLQADAHESPLRSGCIDLVWSYDMQSCVEPDPFYSECARVLAPGGYMVLHAVYFTDLMERNERARLSSALSLTEGCVRKLAESAIAGAGLKVVRTVDCGANWCEAALLEGGTRLAEDHLTVMRLRRGADKLVSQFGEAWYEQILASHQWSVLIALGKLEQTLYVLRKS